MMDKVRIEAVEKSINAHLRSDFALSLKEAKGHELWYAMAKTLMEYISPYKDLREQGEGTSIRQAHYFSAEFLIGRSFLNNALNLDLYDVFARIAEKWGFSLQEILEEELDPALGNGGLGRLAACFLDSAANERLALSGHGILYQYGLFKQVLEDGFQHEYPDAWRATAYPFAIRREEEACLVHYRDFSVRAIPYEIPILGYRNGYVNILQLWHAEPVEAFDFSLFNSQQFAAAVAEKNKVEDICRVLYPNDSSREGRLLRLRQQYFFVSASLQNIIRLYKKRWGSNFSEFSKEHVFQLNDTHPVLAVPEFIRLLMEEALSYEEAWKITGSVFAYTNHTTLQEALERWDVAFFEELFPAIFDIIKRIDTEFRKTAQLASLSEEAINRIAPLRQKEVQMASIACFSSFKINGVAKIHSEILKEKTLQEFYALSPEKFTNKTNGVTPRRWLHHTNPRLGNLLTDLLGSKAWIGNLDLLAKLEKYQGDTLLLEELGKIKAENKIDLAAYLKRERNIIIDPDALFDVQVKRLHEYKRQLLNAFEILDRYYRIKEGAPVSETPVVYLFGAKAASSYYRAKGIIKFINDIAQTINKDSKAAELMQVHFIPNYNVSLAEKIFPASDLSEQISTVGKEASGTGNMKFMMNGALTIGTHDGANIEILEAVGEENAYIFGHTLSKFPEILASYSPIESYQTVEGLQVVVDTLRTGVLDKRAKDMYDDIYHSLLRGNDWEMADQYYVLGDFAEYRNTRKSAHDAYQNQETWCKKAWINICRSGRFSSDRTIREYAKEIWRISAK